MSASSSPSSMDLQSMMAHTPLVVAPETTVMAAIARMGETGSSYVLVVSEGNAHAQGIGVMGILTEQDVVRLSGQSTPLDQLPVQAVMSQPVVTLKVSDLSDIRAVLTLFQQRQIHHLPVLDQEDQLVGLIERACLTELLAQQVFSPDAEALALPEQLRQADLAQVERQTAELTPLNQQLQHTLEELRVAEEELRQQNLQLESERQKYQDLFNFAPDGYLVTNSLGVIQSTNQEIVNQLAVHQTFLQSKPLVLFVAQPDHSLFYAKIAHLERHKQKQIWETTFYSPRRDPFPAEVTVVPIVDQADRVTGLRWLIRDISDRKRLEAERQAAELVLHQYERVVSTTNDCIVLVDRNYVYQVANQAYLDWHEKQREDLLGCTMAAILGESIFQTIKPYLDHCLTGNVLQYEAWFDYPNDCRRFVRVSYSPYAEPDGMIVGVVISLHDLTTLKQAEAALQTNEQFLRSIYEGVEQAIFTLDVLADGELRYVAFNPAAEQISGKSTEQIRGNAPGEKVRQHYLDCLQASTSLSYEECLIFRDQPTWWLTTLNPIRDASSRIWRIVGTSTNITQRKQAEALLELQNTVLERIAKSEPLPEILDTLLRALEMQLVDSLCSIMLCDGTGKLHCEAALHLPEAYLQAIEGIDIGEGIGSCGTAAFRGEPVVVSDVATHPFWQNFKDVALEHGLRACWSMPVIASDGRVLGTFAVYHREIYTPDAPALEVATLAANIASVAIEREQATQALHQLNQELEHRVEERTIALRTSEERWQLALKGTNDGIWDWDLTTNKIFFSSRWKQMRGFTEDEIGDLPDECLSRIHPDDYDRVMAAVDQHFAGNTEFFETEYRTQRKDGSYLWVLDRGQALWDAAGQVVRMSGSETDITQRKQAEEALRESERRYATLAAAAPVAIFRFDTPLNCVYVNDRWSEMTGRPIESALGQGWMNAIHPEDRDRLIPQWADIYAQTLSGNQILLPAEGRHLRPDGSINWFYVQVAQDIDADGNVLGYVGTLTDITDRKQAEMALQKSEQRYRALMDGASDAILLGDSQGNLLEANKNAEILLGYSREELTRLHMSQIHPPEALEAARQHFGNVIQNNLGPPFESLVLRKDGSQVPVDITASRIEIEGEQLAQGIFRDVSERVRLKAERKAIEKQLQLTQYSVDNAVEGILWINLDFRFLYANQAACRMLGYSIEELLQLHIRDVDPDWTPATCQAFREQPQQGSPGFEFETRYRAKDGRIYPVEIIGNYHDFDGQILKIIRVRDISDRKRNEAERQQMAAELAESEAKYRRLVEGVDDVIWSSGADGVITYLSPQFERLFGWKPEVWMGQPFIDLVHPQDRPLVLADYQDSLLLGKKSIQPEFRHRHQNGNYVWVKASVTAVCDPVGAIIGFQGILADIHDRKQAEEALQLSEARYRQIVESQTDFILQSTPDTTITFANMAMCSALGRSLEQIIGLQWSAFVPLEDIKILNQKIAALSPEQPTFENINSDYRANGQLGWTQWINLGIFNQQGELIEIQSVGRDITQVRQAEDALRLSEALSRNAFDNTAVGMCLVAPEGRFLKANAALCNFLGYSEAELLERTFQDITHPDDLASNLEAVRQLLAGENQSCHIEKRYVTQQGQVVWGLLSVSLIRDAQDQPLYFVSQIQDITERKQAEHAIAQYTREVEDLYNNAPCGYHSLDTDGRYIRVNQTELEWLGYSRAEMLGKLITQFFTEASCQAFLNNYEVFRAQGWVKNLEYDMICKDGSILPVMISATAVKDERGNVVYNRATMVDIRDRKQAEIALQESERFIQQIADASPNILYLYDLQEQRNVYVNREIASILGYTPAAIQAMGANFTQNLMHPEDLSQVLPAYCDRVNAAQDGEIIETQYRMRHANGEWRWLYSRDSVFKRDAQGRVQQTIGTAQDITERKHLERDQNRLLAILEASTDYISISDPAGNIIWNNIALKRICGLNSDGEVRHRRIVDYHPQWAMDLILQEGLPAAIATGSWIGETALLDATGQEIPLSQLILAHKSPQGKVEFLSTIARDTRVRKEYEHRLERSNEELLRATRLKDEFLANMSHELRTPLNAILGLAEGLQEQVFGSINPQQLRALETIESSGSHLLELINDILDVAKIEAGQITLNYAPTSIQHLCQSSLAFIKQQAWQKHIQLESILPPNLPDLTADERRLRQVLINLLSNAVKFTPEGGLITLEVSHLPQEMCAEIPLQGITRVRVYRTIVEQALNISPQLSPVSQEKVLASGFLRIAVIDTGIGIAPENIKKLFQPFVQIDSALNRQYAGTGLGLALVKRIVELHGGFVELTSELGQGSCFTICLPWGHPTPPTPAPETQIEPSPEPSQPVPTTLPLILLVEDNEANISTVSSYLEAKRYRILLARDGQAAIDLATTQQPDLILMDIQMPGMDGLEAMRQIRLNAASQDIPIIALTALAMEGDRDRCLAAGANEYLTKPIRLKELFQMIQTLLSP